MKYIYRLLEYIYYIIFVYYIINIYIIRYETDGIALQWYRNVSESD